MASIEEIRSLFGGLEKKLCDKMDHIVAKVDCISLEVNNLKSAQRILESENAMLRNDLQVLRNEVNYLNNKERAQNVILLNVKDSEEVNINLATHVNNILKEINITVPEGSIKDIKRVGRIMGNRPVLLALDSVDFKKKVV